MNDRKLPERFADLSGHVKEWALRTEKERYYLLHTISLDYLRQFYDAMLPRMDEILTFLDQYTMDTMPDDAKTLFDLSMTFAETAHPIDLKWANVDFSDAYPWEKFEFRSVSCADQ